ncbi:dihydrolipoamide dehydrogenase [Buchnera aphidicola str. Bp (Baizongia pistaciae)]|uniref:Dihydrolipoyl dehydrogenase n=1 Tax=Buchnera aphidicola subsp. Baizongia pistaciae (strain Bp) TaxID=224915 RepID=DLDH_BUCBP|nr:dihydrolipoyl dehydrogenase [Buchnera aphidicola]Q89AQ8.1 RecName: Full=Dihydrolipoyl dehydrogenase; AltName: Full=Dihydrolipoamide dehydrogenase; AltName: Full=E3 component of pyruvate and 2-oxoglutarate dehydrogenases complexes [Buchnera aphidicola str. Bp (Baizongia pistaciae)]AAO26923.1 dihydrolipoamide dehydrogenase [Buchnera aphidicola str. Bp (Baizongia pistaciae)]
MISKKVDTQVVIIGSGPSGYSAAFRCSDLGLNVVLIEQYYSLGGVCLNVGCIPSKYLLHIAKVIKDVKKLSRIGISFEKLDINLKEIQCNQKKIIESFSSGISNLARKRNVRIIFGYAKFLDANSIFVQGEHDSYVVSFNKIVIATGSLSKKLSYIPYDDIRIWNSSFAVSIPSIPKKLLIIGGGIIGLEMATIYSALGSNVDIIDNSHDILPHLDRDVIDIFKRSVNHDYNIFFNSNVIKIVQEKNGLLVHIAENDNKNKRFELYDIILVAIGRVPNTDMLDISKVGLKTDNNGFIKVNEQFCTNIPNIYAIGDVIGQPMLAHKGTHEGHIVAEVISGKKHYFNPFVIPCVSYTEPEIAWVGITENEARKNNINYEVSSVLWNTLGRAVSSQCSEGVTKLIFDKKTNKIIGGCIVGSNAGELLGEISLAIEMGCDAEDLALTIHAHPTLYESINLSAQIFQGTITDLINKKIKK